MSKGRPTQRSLTSTEIRDELLEFLRLKFYGADAVAFAKDRPRLLAWVVLEPARWLDERGVTIAADAIRYRPAWLRQVIQSHLRMHGDELYARAKSAAVAIQNAMSLAARLTQGARPDPVRELAQAASLIAPAKPMQRPRKPAAETQLGLF